MGRLPVDLVTKLPHEDDDGAVTIALPATPDALHQLLAADHATPFERECVEGAELCERQLSAASVDEGLDVGRVDDQLLDLDALAAVGRLRPDAATDRRADARDQLAHREGLHQ